MLYFVILLVGTILLSVVWKWFSVVFDLLVLIGGSLWFVGVIWIIFYNCVD